MQFLLLQQQMQQIHQHVDLLSQQNADLDISKKALEEIGKTELDNDIFAPVANGIFVKAALKDNQKLLINVGSNTTVEKTIPEAISLLTSQQTQIVERVAEAEKVLQEMNNQAMKIFEEVQENVQQAHISVTMVRAVLCVLLETLPSLMKAF